MMDADGDSLELVKEEDRKELKLKLNAALSPEVLHARTPSPQSQPPISAFTSVSILHYYGWAYNLANTTLTALRLRSIDLGHHERFQLPAAASAATQAELGELAPWRFSTRWERCRACRRQARGLPWPR